MQDNTDTLGEIIKAARQEADITMEELADRVGVTERYLYRIENEGKKPSYDILKKLIRELSLDSNLIFFPEHQTVEREVGDLLRSLCSCDERSIGVVKATALALIETAAKK